MKSRFTLNRYSLVENVTKIYSQNTDGGYTLNLNQESFLFFAILFCYSNLFTLMYGTIKVQSNDEDSMFDHLTRTQ